MLNEQIQFLPLRKWKPKTIQYTFKTQCTKMEENIRSYGYGREAMIAKCDKIPGKS